MSVAAVRQLADVLQAASELVGQLAGVPRRCWNNRKYGTSERRFQLAKEFIRNLLTVSARDTHNVHHLCSRSKPFKEYLFEGVPN